MMTIETQPSHFPEVEMNQIRSVRNLQKPSPYRKQTSPSRGAAPKSLSRIQSVQNVKPISKAELASIIEKYKEKLSK